MRPLGTDVIPGMPPFLLGLAIIRGSPVPVVALGRIFGEKCEIAINRYVLLTFGERKIALAVESVLGVSRLNSSVLQELPPLLKESDRDLVANIGVKDEQLLVVLRAARMVPEEVWKTLEASGRGQS
jgi:purine-binding chemotaxis protein CheW